MNHEFELRELIRASKRLRDSQRKYFANKDSHQKLHYLTRAKESENEFDRKLEQLQRDLDQTKLNL